MSLGPPQWPARRWAGGFFIDRKGRSSAKLAPEAGSGYSKSLLPTLAYSLCRRRVGLVCLVLASCTPTPLILRSGTVRVSFKGEETCGFENPYTTDAKGCRLLDKRALMCRGFGVIDGVLFAGGCEAPAEARVMETRGTVPVAPTPASAEPSETSTDERAPAEP